MRRRSREKERKSMLDEDLDWLDVGSKVIIAVRSNVYGFGNRNLGFP